MIPEASGNDLRLNEVQRLKSKESAGVSNLIIIILAIENTRCMPICEHFVLQVSLDLKAEVKRDSILFFPVI